MKPNTFIIMQVPACVKYPICACTLLIEGLFIDKEYTLSYKCWVLNLSLVP